MPWANDAQRRACYAKRGVALRQGKKPKWNCEKYGKRHTKSQSKMTTRSKSSGKIVRLSDVRRKIKHRARGTGQVYVGPRGGRYVIYKKQKVYI